jgi:hypothetical protein
MTVVHPQDFSTASIQRIVENAANASDVVFLGDPRTPVDPPPTALGRMRQVLADTKAGWVYSDSVNRPRIDYQCGSIRDGFDFGPLVAFSAAAAREASSDGGYRWGGLYDLRLRISEKHPVVRIPEPLYGVETPSGASQFDYVDPRNRDYQIEMEAIATAHLKRIGAYLEPRFTPFDPAADRHAFPNEASVVIPVRNRERTIAEAVRSALGQKTDFAFNVLVVDNHSTDRTGEQLRGIRDPRVAVIVPERRDLGIGGCWNVAVSSPLCGRYAVQLDSDDLYATDDALTRIVDTLRAGPYAMAIGSYSLVDFQLAPIPPGLIDHREWTRENGRNNALRINGLGAPRAFATSVARRFGFPNVSYGEDYAMALRIGRDYDIGRIYDSIYLCRRWEGNTDSALPLETANRYDFYKDWIRTNEIRARQQR